MEITVKLLLSNSAILGLRESTGILIHQVSVLLNLGGKQTKIHCTMSGIVQVKEESFNLVQYYLCQVPTSREVQLNSSQVSVN